MRDMPNIQELSDAKLAAMASARSDLEIAKDKVYSLETKLAEAQAAHDKKFGFRTFGEGVQESLQNIDRLREQLLNAKDRVDMVDEGVRNRELKSAMEAAPSESFLFEVEAPDGRKIRQTAKDAETLQRALQVGYKVTGKVFPHYVAPLDPGAPNMLDSLLRAHPEALLAWLDAHGFKRRG